MPRPAVPAGSTLRLLLGRPRAEMLLGQAEGLGDRVREIRELADPDREPAMLVRPGLAIVATAPEPDAEVGMSFVFAPTDAKFLVVLGSQNGPEPFAVFRRRAGLAS